MYVKILQMDSKLWFVMGSGLTGYLQLKGKKKRMKADCFQKLCICCLVRLLVWRTQQRAWRTLKCHSDLVNWVKIRVSEKQSQFAILAWHPGTCDKKKKKKKKARLSGCFCMLSYFIKPALCVWNAQLLLWITVIVWLGLPLCDRQLAMTGTMTHDTPAVSTCFCLALSTYIICFFDQ